VHAQNIPVRAIEPGEEQHLISNPKSPKALPDVGTEHQPRTRRSLVRLPGSRLHVGQLGLDPAAASRGGDFDALLALLDPYVVLRADAAAVSIGATAEVRGARETAQTFSGRARAAQPALLDGVPGLVWSQGGAPRVAFSFEIRGGKITGIDLIADPERLRGMEVVIDS
jgi:RNA polymerase sigma-70 factor (ECF subfamily)